MTPSRASRSVFESLMWVPGVFYALVFAKAVMVDSFDRVALDAALPAIAFLLLAAACRAQALRVQRLEQIVLEHRV